MKNEHALNRSLATKMNERSPELKYLKTSDKFAIGISDFLLWWAGKSAAMEVKFIKDYPKRGGSKLLNHVFSGTQRSYLYEMQCAGSYAFGLVGVDSEKRMYLVPYDEIPESGNWSHYVFKQARYTWYDFKDVEGLLSGIFLETQHGK